MNINFNITIAFTGLIIIAFYYLIVWYKFGKDPINDQWSKQFKILNTYKGQSLSPSWFSGIDWNFYTDMDFYSSLDFSSNLSDNSMSDGFDGFSDFGGD